MARREKSWFKKCAELFSEVVKYRDGWKCVETGTTANLQCAHLISRSYHAVCFDLDNAVTLTAGRHVWYTHHPLHWEEFCRKRLGEARYEALVARAMKGKKWSESELKELYAELTHKLEAFRASSR